MNIRRKTAVLPVFGALMVLVLGAVAWACTVQARIIGLSTRAAPAGSEVVVRGEGAQAGAPVAVYWNEVGEDKLAETIADPAGNFAAAVRIPQADPDIHFIVAVPDGAGAARAPFEVTSPGDASGRAIATESTDLWGGFAADGAPGSIGREAVQASSGRGTAGGALGMALLALGAVGFVSGLGVAGARRRSTAAS